MVNVRDNSPKTLKDKLAYFRDIMLNLGEGMMEESTKMDWIIAL